MSRLREKRPSFFSSSSGSSSCGFIGSLSSRRTQSVSGIILTLPAASVDSSADENTAAGAFARPIPRRVHRTISVISGTGRLVAIGSIQSAPVDGGGKRCFPAARHPSSLAVAEWKEHSQRGYRLSRTLPRPGRRHRRYCGKYDVRDSFRRGRSSRRAPLASKMR